MIEDGSYRLSSSFYLPYPHVHSHYFSVFTHLRFVDILQNLYRKSNIHLSFSLSFFFLSLLSLILRITPFHLSPPSKSYDNSSIPTDIAFSADTKSLYVASRGSHIIVHNTNSGEVTQRYQKIELLVEKRREERKIFIFLHRFCRKKYDGVSWPYSVNATFALSMRIFSDSLTIKTITH